MFGEEISKAIGKHDKSSLFFFRRGDVPTAHGGGFEPPVAAHLAHRRRHVHPGPGGRPHLLQAEKYPTRN